MDCKITSTKRDRAAFSVVEVVVASGVAVILVMVVVILGWFSSRSFAAMANYTGLEQQDQFALDKMSREIRQARKLTAFSPSSLTILDSSNNVVQFTYDPDARSLIRSSGSTTNIYLTDCDFLQFTNHQHTVISNTFDAYNPAYVTDTRLIQVTWSCSAKILGAKVNTESVQSAKIVIRNN